MVKKSAAPATAPAKKAPAKRPSKKDTNAREAFKAPVDETGQPADVDTGGGAPMTSGEASQPDKAPAGGWGSASDVDDETQQGGAGDDTVEGGEAKVGWGLDGRQQMVDEEGNDASEAAKVAEANKPKGPRVRKNSKADVEDDRGVNLTGMSKDLISIVERVERLNEEIGALKEDASEVFAEAKAKGYSTTIIRKAIMRRAMDPDKRKEQDGMLALYEEALRGA